MRARASEAILIAALAGLVTIAMAGPVLRAPAQRVFGSEIVGRHHDPFSVMRQFEQPVTAGVYLQPLTDIPGAAAARAVGGVTAYNVIVLVSFPLAAMAAYLLARHLGLSLTGAALAALAYAFSPFHLAHAAYHPHIAQTQWLPLYLLALWRCLDDATPVALGLLVAAAVAVTLSNFYGGLIAAVITPGAVFVYWVLARRRDPHGTRNLARTTGALGIVAMSGIAYALLTAGAVLAEPAAFAFQRADLFLHSATWMSYLVPPVAHPLLGASARDFWSRSGVGPGLLEQQVSLGWGVMALGSIAAAAWLVRRAEARPAVPILLVVAGIAFTCSLSPETTIGAVTLARPSAVLYDVVPMFRSYARFGVVVQLMAALLAGLGLDALRRAGTMRPRLLAVALVAIACAEYLVLPAALWRDVLPTAAHRWIVQQPGHHRALDCVSFGQESSSVPWLTADRIGLLGGVVEDCAESDIAPKLQAAGYSHLLLRNGTAEGAWLAGHRLPGGLTLAAGFDDARVFAVTIPPPAVYTASMRGFFDRERDAEWTWRWMGSDASWMIENTRERSVAAAVDLDLQAFHRARRMNVLLDGRHVQTLVVGPARAVRGLGPFTVPPGTHTLAFQSDDVPTIAADVMGNGDVRPLSFAFGAWRWTMRETNP